MLKDILDSIPDVKRKNPRNKQMICDCCKSIFISSRRDAKYCSPTCRQNAYRDKKKPGLATVNNIEYMLIRFLLDIIRQILNRHDTKVGPDLYPLKLVRS